MSDLSNSKKVALGGFVVLLSVLCLYLASILPTNKIFFFCLSTIFIAAIVIEFKTYFSLITYGAISILGFMIIPNKLIMVPYVIYFGYYGIIKYYIEKINNILIEWIIKIVLFNLFVYATYIIAVNLFISNIDIKLPIWIILLLLQVFFIIYDICYSLAIKYYKYKIRRFLKVR
ncbi:hypothetical protein SAMN02745135_01643 [Caloranaerobacter azorensis DSM 13643]|uniref:Uncharacterized protein n=1 Tax=Caloranaerobacter azorensis DSM 13643 TaxID=1121264 RepID=A0A1M5UYB2_9FIRM|nr:hypothetical protein [Caloranaerobacter azorensis]SHH67916.1 hypothetical protein SAMN02745135_01643 [Caloranaerobacter azorensis DSM 13643]